MKAMSEDWPEPDALIQALETRTLPRERFHHESHVFLAWHYIRLGQEDRFVELLKQFFLDNRMPNGFNATITYFFIYLTRQRYRHNPELPWAEFIALNPDIADFNIIRRYYVSTRIDTVEAQAAFILPEPFA
jgi:hypothetical protein